MENMTRCLHDDLKETTCCLCIEWHKHFPGMPFICAIGGDELKAWIMRMSSTRMKERRKTFMKKVGRPYGSKSKREEVKK